MSVYSQLEQLRYTNPEKNSIDEIFIELMLERATEFLTCRSNLLDLVYCKECIFFAEKDEKLCETYDCTEERTIKFAFEIPYQTLKILVETARNFRKANYEEITELTKRLPQFGYSLISLKSTNITNINNIYH